MRARALTVAVAVSVLAGDSASAASGDRVSAMVLGGRGTGYSRQSGLWLGGGLAVRTPGPTRLQASIGTLRLPDPFHLGRNHYFGLSLVAYHVFNRWEVSLGIGIADLRRGDEDVPEGHLLLGVERSFSDRFALTATAKLQRYGFFHDNRAGTEVLLGVRLRLLQ